MMKTRDGTALRTWAEYRGEFPIFETATYLSTCSLAPLARRVEAAVHDYLRLWHAVGSSAWYGPWWEEIATLRARVARVVGATTDEVALFPSITAALSAVASALDYRARPRVVMSALEFPTTRYQWQVKGGVETVEMASPDGMRVFPEQYEAAVDGRTALVVGSHVYFTSGIIQDIVALADIAHARGALCLIDAYQSVGQLPLEVRAAGVDFLVGGALKWLLGGSGLAFLYVRGDLLPRLRPEVVGWFAHRDQFAFAPEFEYAEDARRFEGGTPSVAAVYAASAGLALVEEIGPERLRARQLALTADLVERAREAGLAPRVPADLTHHAGIVTIPRRDPPAAVQGLREAGVIVDARPGVVRVSPYFYNTPEDHQRAIDAMTALSRRGVD
jgi:selenocysteine lyase/cysteine desulfurase